MNFEYFGPGGKVQLRVGHYDDSNLGITLLEMFTGTPVANLTDDFSKNLTPYFGAIRRDNKGFDYKAFLKKEKLAVFYAEETLEEDGAVAYYHVYLFHRDRLMEIDPAGCKQYETQIGSRSEETPAIIHSLAGKATVEIIYKMDGDNQYTARYQGQWYSAIYNVFSGLHFVDDKYGALPEDIGSMYEEKWRNRFMSTQNSIDWSTQF